ncbi:major head protein [Gordonia phage Arri]|uniref:Major capsid protein n=1 Tax=Gordonia phage Arri TaxID=2588127 RepID=A0A4Y5TZE0_9CAUD|nr:major head protein [Gordonia phage Arri]QDB74799.1 major capsid hexamer protein [Gordonia phage Arri]
MELTLQDLLDAAHGAGEEGQAPTPEQRATAIREKLAGADRPAIEALQDEAIEKWGELNATDPTDEEGLAGLEALTEFVQVTRSVQSDLDAADEQARARRAEMEAKIKGTKGDAEGGEDEGAEGENAGEGGEGEGDGGQGADDSAAAATESTEGGDSGQGAEGASAAEAAPAAEAVVASAKRNRFDLAAIGKRTPKPKPQAEDERPRGFSITAAARVRGYETGQALDLDGVVAAAQARIENMPRGVKGLVQQEDIANFKLEFPEELVASGKDDNALLDYAASQSRLRGGSIVAAGGWCAPSETLYELSPVLADATAGLIDVPEISVKRGGVRTTEGADYAAIYSGGQVGVRETEAQAIANASDDDYQKVLYRVPCTDFVEKRAGVVYTGIEAGILQNSAYPELTRQHVETAMAAHAHRVNELTIADMVTASTPVDLTGTLGPSATGAILNGLELLIVDFRYRYRAPESMLLEVPLPIWTKLHVRSDLALRSGVDFNQVTDQQINAFFLARGARVQWVYDWQDAFSGVANGFGAANPKTTFNTTVKAMVYPAGTFVRGRGEIISLGVTYDSVNIRKNDFLEMFNEEKLLVHKRAYKSLVATLPIAVTGVSSAPVVLTHGGQVAPAEPETP